MTLKDTTKLKEHTFSDIYELPNQDMNPPTNPLIKPTRVKGPVRKLGKTVNYSDKFPISEELSDVENNSQKPMPAERMKENPPENPEL